MKILVLNWRDIKNPEAGGAEVHLHEVFGRLARQGHKVVLVSCGFQGAPEEEEIDGIAVVRVGGKYSYPLWTLLRYLRTFRGRFDVVVDDISKMPLFTPLLSKEPQLAIWHMSHASILSKEFVSPVATLLAGWERLLSLVYRKTPFVVVSPSTRDDLVQAGVPANKIHVVYNGVAGARDNDVCRARLPLVVYVGRVVPYKRLDHLLDALRLVRETVPDASLVIAGRGTDYKRLENLADDFGLNSDVTFRGPVTEEEKATLLQQAWVFGMPSSHEGWGISILEANVRGVPAVAYNVPGVRDAVIDGETGLLVEDGDIAALALAIERLCQDDSLRESLGEAAVAHARRFSWDDAATDFADILEETRLSASQRHSG